MIVQDLNNLPMFGPNDVVICDCETTSWDDDVKGLNPFQGSRVCGFALSTEDGAQGWYLPVRHHGDQADLFHKNLPLLNVQQYMRDLFACPTRVFANHNAKFDARFMHFDGIKFECSIEDVIVLARLVEDQRDKRFGGSGYGLDALAFDYLGARKDGRVKAYTKALKTKDWGRVPIRLMGEYAVRDATLTARLRLKLLRKLPEVSQTIWKIEQRVSKLLLDSEIYGIPLNVPRLKRDYAVLLQKLIDALTKIHEVAGWEVNVVSNTDLTKFLTTQLGIKPTSWTDAGVASWTALHLEMLAVPPGLPKDLGVWLSQAARLSHEISLYCEGWLKALGDDGRLHADFRQWGTVTGRLSSSGPNAQNFDELSEAWIEEVDADQVLVYFDLSQAEYRVFGHYTKAPRLIDAYAEDPDMDFHLWLADQMGVSRSFAKTMNFSFIYGMGKKKLLQSLSALLAISLKRGTDERTNMHLRLLTRHGGKLTDGAGLFSSAETSAAAEQLFNQYHTTLPAIRKFQKLVSNLCRTRGWIRNYFGRVYHLPARQSYVGVNRIVQGTIGDYMKERAATIFERTRELDVHMIDEVHDSSVWSLPRRHVAEFVPLATKILEDSEFRIPIRVNCKVSARSWSQLIELPRDPTPEQIHAALEESVTHPLMTWDTREAMKLGGSSSKGDGGTGAKNH